MATPDEKDEKKTEEEIFSRDQDTHFPLSAMKPMRTWKRTKMKIMTRMMMTLMIMMNSLTKIWIQNSLCLAEKRKTKFFSASF